MLCETKMKTMREMQQSTINTMTMTMTREDYSEDEGNGQVLTRRTTREGEEGMNVIQS